METEDKGRFHSPFAATEGSSMSGTIGAHLRQAVRRPSEVRSAAAGLPLAIALPLAIILTIGIVTATSMLVERLG